MDVERVLKIAKDKLNDNSTEEPKANPETDPLLVAMEDFSNAKTPEAKARAFKAALELAKG